MPPRLAIEEIKVLDIKFRTFIGNYLYRKDKGINEKYRFLKVIHTLNARSPSKLRN